VFNTQDSPPRNGEGKRRPTAAFRNIGVGAGALGAGAGVGYAGLKIGKAAEDWQKSSPAFVGRAVKAKTKGAWARLMAKLPQATGLIQRHLFQARLKELRFAKPGEMFRKYAPESGWLTDPAAKALFGGATAIGTTHKDIVGEYAGAVEPSRSKQLSKFPPRGRIVVRRGVRQYLPEKTTYTAHVSPGKREKIQSAVHVPRDLPRQGLGKRMSPQRERMMKADIAANLTGEHGEYHEARKKIVDAHRYEINVTHKGHPEHIIETLKEKHKNQLAAFDENYHAQVRAQPAYGIKMDALRKNIRASAAAELKGRRDILQGLRRHIGSIAAPLPATEIGRIKQSAQRMKKVGRYTRKVYTGIAARHGAKAPFILGGKEQPNLPAAISEAEGKLQSAITQETKRRNLITEKIHDKLVERAKTNIQKIRTSGIDPVTGVKDIEMPPHPAKRLEAMAKRTVHHAIINPVPPEGATKAMYAAHLGLKHPDQLDVVRQKYEHLRSPDYASEQAIRSHILKEGKIFAPRRAGVQTYRHLKTLGKVGAIGAGVLGAGYLARRLLGRREPVETQFAVPGAVRRIQSKLKDWRVGRIGKHELILGGALAGGITAADALTSAVFPDPEKSRKESAWAGAKRGAVYGTALAGAEPLIRIPLSKRFKLASRLKLIQFQNQKNKDSFGRDVAVGGIEGGLGFLGTERLLKKYGPKNLSSAGKFGLAAGVGGLATGTIGYALNRFLRSRRQQQQQNPILMAAKLKEIQFQEWADIPSPGRKSRRLSVAQDRYRKIIREREIQRKESNLARSALAGAALAGAVHGRLKIPLKPALAGGAAAGLTTQAALIARGRRSRDPYGEESIASKRIERIPYQAGALATGGILGHKLYKSLKFRSKSKVIRFAMSEEERAARRRARRWEPERLPRRAEEFYTRVGRGGRLIRDIEAQRRGELTDPRGRKRTPEWQKPWAKRAVGIGLILGAFKARPLLKAAMRTPIIQKAESGIKGAWHGMKQRSPLFAQTIKSGKQFGGELRGELRDIRKRLTQEESEPALKAVEKEASEQAAAHRRKATEQAIKSGLPLKFRSRLKEIRLAETVPYWDIRDERGRSARIYAPGSQRRTRREKKWHERKAARDLLWSGLAIGALGTGAGTATLIHGAEKRALTKTAIKKKIISPGTFSPLENILRDYPTRRLSSILDGLINFSSITYHETQADIHKRKASVHKEKSTSGFTAAVPLGIIGAAALSKHSWAPDAILRGARFAPKKVAGWAAKHPRTTVHAVAYAPAAAATAYGAGHQLASWRQRRLASSEQKQAQKLRLIRNARANKSPG
jgi:hypothetical protein